MTQACTHDTGLQIGSNIQFQHALCVSHPRICTTGVMLKLGHKKTLISSILFSVMITLHQLCLKYRYCTKDLWLVLALWYHSNISKKLVAAQDGFSLMHSFFSGEDFEQTVNKQVKRKQTKNKQVVAVLIS